MLFRASTMRTFTRIPVGISRVGVSVLDTDNRGVGKPGKVKIVCVHGNMGVHSFVRKNTRRHRHHTNARGIPNVIKVKGTTRLTITGVRGGARCRMGLHSRLVRHILTRVPCARLGKSHASHLPGGTGFYFQFVRKRSVLVLLSRTKVYNDDKDTYASKSLSPSRILLTVKLPRRVTRKDLHLALSRGAAVRSVSCAMSGLGTVVRHLHDVSPLCRSFIQGGK